MRITHFTYSVCFVLCVAHASNGKVTFNHTAVPYIIEIKEHEPINTTITTLHATSSTPNQTIVYEIKSTNNEISQYITINPHSGRISNIIALDSEVKLVLIFQAVASAGTEKATSLVVLQIHNINDNAPIFPNTTYQYVDENVPYGSVVGKISANDADRVEKLFYSLTNTTNATFAIAIYSGEITTIQPLDYEAKKIYNLNITVTDGLHTSYGTLVVHVNDMDDQGTAFDNNYYYAYLDEGAYTNETLVVPVHAYDLDLGRNESVTYSLVHDTIVPYDVQINSTTGKLYITGNIDYEEGVFEFVIQVEAVSTTFPAVHSIVLLRIKDINDNAPYFAYEGYHGNVFENSLIGTFILRLKAYDIDQGNNSLLSYRINNTQSLPFLITADGEIQVNGSLDRETQDLYTFQVLVEETLTKERYQNHTTVTIQIIDRNDNTPYFHTDLLQLQVEENIQPPVVLANLTSADNDTGLNAERRYSIQHHSSGVFYIDAVTGALSTNQTLDRETQDKYEFQLVVHDLAPIEERRWSTLNVIIDVLDINDNTPSCVQPRSHAGVSEAVPNNTFITRVEAVDVDYGNNSVVKYAIIGGNLGNKFKIDSKSGEVKTIHELDRETTDRFLLLIIALDGGDKNVTCELEINVSDVNDNQPLFSQDNYTFNVYENEDVGTHVGIVLATDKDKGNNGLVSYSIQSLSHRFVINQDTGNISTSAMLDREVQSTHTLLIKARDAGNQERLFTYTQVFVNVLDKDDNGPLFSGTGSGPVLIYRSMATIGETVYTLTADDEDTGGNAVIKFGNYSEIPGFLSLNATTGELKVIHSVPTFIIEVKLELKAYSPSSPWYDTLNMSINFLSSSFYNYPKVSTASIKENLPAGSPLVLDQPLPVLNPSGLHRQFYCGNDCPFQLGDNGVISTTKILDREYKDEYTLFIMIGSMATFVPIHVRVVDIDDHAPYCVKRYEFTVAENSEGTFYLDGIKDNDMNTDVYKYEITSKYNSKIQISNSTLFVNQLDYEVQPRYDIQFLISGKTTGKSSKCHITLHVEDVNDNPPIFDVATMKTALVETVPIGTLVKTIQANDADTNSNITYEIMGGNSEGVFTIDSTTGNMYTAMSVSTLVSDVVTLLIKVNDHVHRSNSHFNITIVRRSDIVQLITERKPLAVKLGLQHLESKLSEKTSANVKVVQLDRISDDSGTIIGVYGIAHSTKITQTDIEKVLDDLGETWEVIKEADVTAKASKFTVESEERNTYIGVIIAISALLILLLSIGIYFWYQRRKSLNLGSAHTRLQLSQVATISMERNGEFNKM